MICHDLQHKLSFITVKFTFHLFFCTFWFVFSLWYIAGRWSCCLGVLVVVQWLATCVSWVPHSARLATTDQSQIDFSTIQLFQISDLKIRWKPRTRHKCQLLLAIGRQPDSGLLIGGEDANMVTDWLQISDKAPDWTLGRGATLLSNISLLTMECS